MKKWALAVPVVLAPMLIAPGSALAGTPHFPTTVVFDGSVEASDGDGIYTGHLESPKPACVIEAGRFMRLYADDAIVDLEFTSFYGAWAMKADTTGVSTLEARVVRYRFGPKGHRKICDPDSVLIKLA